MDIIDKLTESLGIQDLYNNLFNKLFKYTYDKDLRNKKKYDGYPTATTRSFDLLSQKTGIPFVNQKKRDYTFAPIIDHIMFNTGLTNSSLHDTLRWINMRCWGEPTKHGRLKAQKKLLDAYLEYENKSENVSIIENLLNQEHPYYILKILAIYKVQAVEQGLGFDDFILNNKNYFKEIIVFYTMEERTVIDSTRDAVKELETLTQSTLRAQLVKANFIYAMIDLVIFIISFGEYMIPEVLTNFEVGIEAFSPEVRFIDNLSTLFTTRWYLLIAISIPIIAFFKTKFVHVFTDYLKIKAPGINKYIMDEELLKFLKTYVNIMEYVPPRTAYKYSYNRLTNEYLRHVMYRHINGSETDLINTAKPISEILADIPYINKEYTDIMVQSYLTGKPQEGIQKVIDIIEPRVETASKEINKNVFIAVTVITTAIFLLFAFFMYRDAMNIVELSDQIFLDELRK